MNMPKGKAILGLACVVAGTVMVLGGASSATSAASAVWANLDLILIVIGSAALGRHFLQRDIPRGPVAVATCGLVLLAWRQNWIRQESLIVLVGTVVLLGGANVALGAVPAGRSDTAVQTVGALLARRKRSFGIDEEPPERLRAWSLLGRIDLDLRRAEIPRYGPIELLISSWGGDLRLRLPNDWVVVAGRTRSSYRMHLSGLLDSKRSFNDPDSPEQLEQLERLREERSAQTGSTRANAAVVVHLLGVGGRVKVSR